MLAFILRRLIQAVIVMVTVAFISFMLFQYVGDPVVFLLGQDATPEQIRELRASLGLDKPFFVQFGHFLVNAAQGEFGLSLRQGAKVSRLIAERFPATLELATLGTLIGGQKVIKTLGVGLTDLKPMGGFSAETAGAFTLAGTAILGIPVSTTHTITGAIMGVGVTRRLSAIKWGTALNIVAAWIMTIPFASMMAMLIYWALGFFIST